MNADRTETVTLAEVVGTSLDAWLRVSIPEGSILRQDHDTGTWLETGWRINPVTSELEVLCDGVFEPRGLVYEEETGTLRRLAPAPAEVPLRSPAPSLLRAPSPYPQSSTTVPSQPADMPRASSRRHGQGRTSGLWKRKQTGDTGSRDFLTWIGKPSAKLLVTAWALLSFSALTRLFASPGDPLHSLGKWVVWLLVIPIVVLLWRRSGLHAAAMVVIAFILGRSFHLQQVMAAMQQPRASQGASAPVSTGPSAQPQFPPPQSATSLVTLPAERPPFSRSPDGKYSVEIFGDTNEGQIILVKERGDHLFEQPSIGYLLDVHWSSTGRFLAVNERRANSGDYLWIMDLQRQAVLKKPEDGLWREMESHCISLLEGEARKLWGPEVEADKNWGLAAEWEGAGILIAKVVVRFYGDSIPKSSPGSLEARVKLRVNDQGARLQTAGVKILEPIGTALLEEWYKFYHDKTTGELTVVSFAPARFGVVRTRGNLNDLNLAGITMVPAPDRASGKSVRIILPLASGKSGSAEFWSPTGETFSWSTPPARTQSEVPSLEVLARGSDEARAWIGLLKNLTGPPDAPPNRLAASATSRPGAADGEGAILPEGQTLPPVSPSPTRENPYPGEKFPQTRQRLLNNAEIEQMTGAQIRYAINEMFARHGGSFAKEELRRVFEAFSWYRARPEVTFDAIEKEDFSTMERANLLELARARDKEAAPHEGNPFPGEKYPQTRLRLLATAEVDQMTDAQIRYAINEMFARHGASFAKEEISRGFGAFSWYRANPEISFDTIEKHEFSAIERANLKELARARDKR